jgi:nucleoside-diphosphate-sugar epimerase
VVLGGAGFIGSNLTLRLLADGYQDVRVVDVAWPAFRDPFLEGADRADLDLTDPMDAAKAVAGAGTVFHLAADMGGVGYFHSDADLGAAMRNGRITLNVLDAAATAGVQRLFYASSACTYPIERQMHPGVAPLLTEDLIGHGTPDALYGAEKLHGLRLCSKLPFARVGVLHTVYGPGQEHDGRRMKFPAAVATKALVARSTGTLELWGDGAQLRSYLYVDDAVDRILTVTTADQYEGPVNIGLQGAVSCRVVARLCLKLAGADAEIVTNPAEPSGVIGRDCSNEKYRRVYGRPTCLVGYREGFRRFLDWLEAL